MWGGRLGKPIIDLFKREKADIICIQEAIDIPGGWAFFFESLSDIKTQAGYQHCFFTPVFGYKVMNRRAKGGPAILSNLPFSETHETFTRLAYVEDFDLLGGDYNIRCLQHAVVEHGGQKLNILNHHGHQIPEHKNGDEETMRQCKMIVEYLQKLSGPVVLCGDFNLAPDSESLEQINKVLVNQSKKSGVTTTRTPLTHKTEVCDYIFTSPDIEVESFHILDDIVSDHKALTLEF